MFKLQFHNATISIKMNGHASSHNMLVNIKPFSFPIIICKKTEDNKPFAFPKPTFSKSAILSSVEAPLVSLTEEAITTTSIINDHVERSVVDHHEINSSTVVKQLPGDLRQELMPKHVAVIMDGHGRWAKNKGYPTQFGHYVGFMVRLRALILSCCELGIQVFTVYAFSSENWSRSKEEIDCLMGIFEDLIQTHIKELIYRHDIHFSVIGDRTRLPESLQDAIFEAEESSISNKGMDFVMAISYSGRNEITEAVKNIAQKIEDGTLRAKEIDTTVLEQQLEISNTTKFPNLDLLIRTSGELRLSNFMLWQSAYAEFYFCDKLLPDFGEDDLIKALESFQRRKRRYGGRKN